MEQLFQGFITFLTELFAAIEAFTGKGTGSGTGSGFSDFLASIREMIGA